jgi:hypothetical protein
MTIHYVFIKNPQYVLDFNERRNPWKLVYAGEDTEKAWRSAGLYQKDSPIRVYSAREVQIRRQYFKTV